MITTTPELKLEEKIIYLCNIPGHRLSAPLSVA